MTSKELHEADSEVTNVKLERKKKKKTKSGAARRKGGSAKVAQPQNFDGNSRNLKAFFKKLEFDF